MKRLIYMATLALFGTILLTILVTAESGAGLDIRRRVVAGLGVASTGSGRMQVSSTPAKPAPGIQTSEEFDLSRRVIAGGGGTSSAGKFQIDGTIGPPDRFGLVFPLAASCVAIVFAGIAFAIAMLG